MKTKQSPIYIVCNSHIKFARMISVVLGFRYYVFRYDPSSEEAGKGSKRYA